jgi:hypothetical protein
MSGALFGHNQKKFAIKRSEKIRGTRPLTKLEKTAKMAKTGTDADEGLGCKVCRRKTLNTALDA